MKFIKKHSKGLIVSLSLLLVACVFGMASFTFARYTSSDSTTQQATVAKWGYVISLNADNLFGAKYGETADNLVKVSASGTSIVSEASTNVIAPGSTGSLSIQLSGKAEVLAALSFTLESVSDVSIKKDSDSSVYNPIKWTLKDGETPVSGAENIATGDLTAKLSNLSQASIAAGTAINKTYTLSWVWALDGGNDAADTALGQAANGPTPAGWSEAQTTLGFKLTVEIKQIQ